MSLVGLVGHEFMVLLPLLSGGMRAYRLHNASWSRIVTHRVRRPEVLADRMSSRRRPAQPVPSDGQLVLINCNHQVDPRTNGLVDRRELLDRLIEALSIPEVDGVVGSADILEELTLLNVLEHRLAFSTAACDPQLVVAGHFDGAVVGQSWDNTGAVGYEPWCVAADIAELAAHDLPTILDLSLTDIDGRTGFDTIWNDWIEPMHATASSIATGAGVWISLPAIRGLSHIAEATGFPILLRDTEIPIHPSAWEDFFQTDLPLTIRGMMPGVSALFPLEGSVAEATARIARGVRSRIDTQRAA